MHHHSRTHGINIFNMAAIFRAITIVLISVVSCSLLYTKEIRADMKDVNLNSQEVNITTQLFTTQISAKKKSTRKKGPKMSTPLDPNETGKLQLLVETSRPYIDKTAFTLSTADLEGTTKALLTANSQTSFIHTTTQVFQSSPTTNSTQLFQSSPTTNSNLDQELETTESTTNRASVLNNTVKGVARGDTKQSTMGHGLVWWIAVVGGAGLAVIILLSSLTFLFYRPWRKNKMVQLRHPPKKTNENLYGKMKTSARTSNSLKRIRKKNSCYSKVLNKEAASEDDQYQRTQSIFSWGTEFDAFDPISEQDTVSTKGGYANTTLLFSQANVQALNNTTSSESDLGTGCSPNCSSEELLGKYINANTIV